MTELTEHVSRCFGCRGSGCQLCDGSGAVVWRWVGSKLARCHLCKSPGLCDTLGEDEDFNVCKKCVVYHHSINCKCSNKDWEEATSPPQRNKDTDDV